MSPRSWSVAAVAAFALLVTLTPLRAEAGEVYCSTFGGTLSGYLNDNVKVDTDCWIDKATVNGNVKLDGAYQLVISYSKVNGNIECDYQGSLRISDSKVNGNIEKCQSAPGDKPWSRKGVFQASLDGYQEVPAISTSGEGQFRAEVVRSSGMLRYALRYRGLEGGNVLFAHIHFGRPGTNGDVIAFLCSNMAPPVGVDTPPCPAEGVLLEGELDRFDVIGPAAQGIDPGEAGEALRALEAGAAYVNVHTAGFPSGEIRGQIEAGRGKKGKKGRSR